MQRRILKRGFSSRSGRRAMLRTGKDDLVPHTRVRHLDVGHDERSEHALLAGWGVSYPIQHAQHVELTMSKATPRYPLGTSRKYHRRKPLTGYN